jgi:rhamnosyltransferase
MCPADAAGLQPDHEWSCVAIVVSWQPDLSVLGELLRQLTAQSCPVIMIDNGSSNADALSRTIAAISPNISLIGWSDNKGLATALNEGLKQALAQGYRCAFMFDQDSCIDSAFCDGMQQAWQKARAVSPQPVAAVGPRLQDPESGRRAPFRKFGWWRRSNRQVSVAADLYNADFLITSGTLLSLPALDDTGLMKDEYFIDNIDLEWCFRARAHGYALYGTDAACLYHRIGEQSENPLVKAGILVKHSPLRSYYSTRNRLHLWRQGYAPLDWKLRDMLRFVLKATWLLVFSGQGSNYWREIRRGIKDSRTLT